MELSSENFNFNFNFNLLRVCSFQKFEMLLLWYPFHVIAVLPSTLLAIEKLSWDLLNLLELVMNWNLQWSISPFMHKNYI